MGPWRALLRRVPARWVIVVQVIPFVAALYAAKLVIDVAGADFITLTTLFGSIIAANVFLLGFLLAGTLADYKESERLPGELASSIESMGDECLITLKNKDAEEAREAIVYLSNFAVAVRHWFCKEERTRNIMERISGLNDVFLSFEPLTQPNFIVRMKQEQAIIRKIITRIDTIRDTSFVPAGYMMAELGTAVLLTGLLFTELGTWYEAIFYVVVPAFFMLYLIFLIKDLDNPFNYSGDSVEAADVSIKPILDVEQKLLDWARAAPSRSDAEESGQSASRQSEERTPAYP
jgi:hypothetical protein